MRHILIRFLCFLLFFILCDGLPRFANYMQDHIVLQQAPQRAVVWGFEVPRTLTILTINNKTYTTVSGVEPASAQNESIWSVTLDPVSDEGPFDIYVSQPLANGTLVTIILHDVLFGDVWICSGQSNMQFTMNMIFNASEEIANAGNYPKIRVFTAALRSSEAPIEELLGIVLNWSVASSKSIDGPSWSYMSAVCWLYSRMIHQALDGRPMGLIATSWGGTTIELNDVLSIESFDDSSVTPALSVSTLFNSMIYPFTRMVIYGAICEANRAYHLDKYACSFAKMIQYWRQIWNERTNGSTDLQFPFGFVQLATYVNNSDFIGSMPWLRWHQTFDVGYVPNNVVPRIFMAVALDLRDDANGIHPRCKQDVGYRLSRSAFAVVYGHQIEYQGPIVDNVAYSTGSQTVNITYKTVSSIELRNPVGFEVCCQGSQCVNGTIWVPAAVSSKSSLAILLTVDSSCIGKQLYDVRYLWRETACPSKQAAIYSGTDSNLPSLPYLKLF